MNEKEYRQAQQAGMFARQSGRKLDACQRYGITPEARTLRDAWRQGWEREDEARKRK